MKTPVRTGAFKSLSSVNREFTHSQFIHAEFDRRVRPEIEAEPHRMTSAAFRGNPFCDRFNWKLSEFHTVFRSYELYLRKSFWVFTYAVVEAYFNDCLELYRKLIGKPDKQEDDEHYFRYVIRVWNPHATGPDREFITTLDFIRLIRNCIIHRGGDVNAPLAELKRNNGTTLDRFWGGRTKSFSFKTFLPDECSADNLIEIFTITRDCIRCIDEEMTRAVEVTDLCKGLWQEFCLLNEARLKGKSPDVRLRKFRAYCRDTFGLYDLPEEVAQWSSVPLGEPIWK